DLAKVKLRGFALVWLATDLVAAGERGNHEDIFLDWPECQRNLDIPDVLLPFIYAAGDHRVMTRMFNRGDFAMEWELPDVGLADLDEEFDSEHALKVCSDVQFALCAYLMRKEVARVLDTGSGGLLTT